MSNGLKFFLFMLVGLAFLVFVDYGQQERVMDACRATGRSAVECEMLLRLHGRMP